MAFMHTCKMSNLVYHHYRKQNSGFEFRRAQLIVLIMPFQGSSTGVYEEVRASHQAAAGGANEEAKCEGN